MKKENILVVAIICIAIAGAVGYYHSNHNAKSSAEVGQMDDGIEKKAVQAASNALNIKADVSNTKADVSNIAAVSSGIDWQSYMHGLDLAKREIKPVFLYFEADWCTYCKKLKNTTFVDRKVLSYLSDNFISIAIDTDSEQALARQWGVTGVPTLWFLKADNSEISNLPGYVDPDTFLNILKYIRTQSYEKMSFSDFLKT